MPGIVTRGECLPGEKKVYLTFDDGPIPEATPWVLGCLARYEMKATFFVVGDNVRKYPHLLEAILARGHAVGNHTMHHLQGLHTSTQRYIADIEEADGYLTPQAQSLFRPPHGLLRPAQLRALKAQGRKVILHDLLTRDYSKYVAAHALLPKIHRHIRPGSIIVFHDSLRSIVKLRTALPEILRYLQCEGWQPSILE